jgi:uncharacterized protein YbaR (Trm112 family)
MSLHDSEPLAVYVCPECHGSLEVSASDLRCETCQKSYPVQFDIVDFSGGEY